MINGRAIFGFFAIAGAVWTTPTLAQCGGTNEEEIICLSEKVEDLEEMHALLIDRIQELLVRDSEFQTEQNKIAEEVQQQISLLKTDIISFPADLNGHGKGACFDDQILAGAFCRYSKDDEFFFRRSVPILEYREKDKMFRCPKAGVGDELITVQMYCVR